MQRRRTSLTMDPELFRRVRSLADELAGASMSDVVEMALEMYLPHLEAMVAASKGATPEERSEAAMNALFRSLVNTLKEDETGRA